tara:strand:- start:1750 stop:2517 length:768 start_codon:yes stop_codon:yes gene_type:complete
MDNTILDNRTLSLSWLGNNDTVCHSVDTRLEQLVEMRNRATDELADPAGVIVPIFVILGSCVCLFLGARLFRFTAAFAAAGFSFYVVYKFGRDVGERISCEALIIMASIFAAFGALMAGCIYKAGLFFVGAAAMAFIVHLVFSTFPELHEMGDHPTLAKKSIVYWAMIMLAGIAGGLILRWHSIPILEIITACVGGAGVAYALSAIATVAEANVDEWVFMVSGLCATLVGTSVQRQVRLRGCKRRQTNAEPVARI